MIPTKEEIREDIELARGEEFFSEYMAWVASLFVVASKLTTNLGLIHYDGRCWAVVGDVWPHGMSLEQRDHIDGRRTYAMISFNSSRFEAPREPKGILDKMTVRYSMSDHIWDTPVELPLYYNTSASVLCQLSKVIEDVYGFNKALVLPGLHSFDVGAYWDYRYGYKQVDLMDTMVFQTKTRMAETYRADGRRGHEWYPRSGMKIPRQRSSNSNLNVKDLRPLFCRLWPEEYK